MKYKFRYIVLFFILLYAVVTVLFFNFYKNLAIQDTKQEAISILNTMKALRLYIENTQRPLIYDLKNRDMLDKNFFDPKILSSSYITKHIYDILLRDKKINYTFKLAAANPTNLENMATGFEVKILKQFQNNEIKQYFDTFKKEGVDYFYIALPISINKPSCLECHGDPASAPPAMIKLYGDKHGFHEKVDEIRALISLKAPVKDIVTYHAKEFIIGGLAMLGAFMTFIFFVYMLYRKEMILQSKKEKLLENQNKLASLGEMINNIAHQWRQPLAQISSILVNMELRGKQNKLTQKIVEEKIKEANEQISFMSQTIDDFRNFYLKQQEHNEYYISEAIEHAYQLVSASIYENDITLDIEIQDDYMLFGYSNDLIQAIINIINNAKDALVENSIQEKEIHIKTYMEENSKILIIEDNAGGIKESIMEKIFDPYFTSKHPSIGTGIGLYMSKIIIEKKHGGTIKVENTEVGAKFIITFESKVSLGGQEKLFAF